MGGDLSTHLLTAKNNGQLGVAVEGGQFSGNRLAVSEV